MNASLNLPSNAMPLLPMSLAPRGRAGARFVLAAGFLVAAFVHAAGAQAGPKFEISVARSAHAAPITGRMYVALSRTNSVERGPIAQAGETGAPLFAVDIEALAAGTPAVIDARTFGHPVQSLRDIPAGEYWVQPFVNVYTKFARSDGRTIWAHMDQWEGQNWRRSPGNLFGEPQKIRFDPASSQPIRLVVNQVIPAIVVPADSGNVRRIKLQSTLLSKFWGHPIFLGAVVLLPKDYDAHPEARYPVVYSHGHFSLRAPGVGSTPYWNADGTPRMIIVTLQHPSPFYDDSYGVNSANNGPFGDAIMQELIPAVESQFRVIGQPWARLLTGGSTGGWISFAHQVLYPEFYGGTWSLCPDALDFRYHQIVDIYSDTNAYWFDREWTKVDRPTRRKPDGNITAMMKDENWFEYVVGNRSRSGGQWDIWEATFGPVGTDGYPARIWDKRTGVIDRRVAEYWKEHYDLRYLLESKWATLGPKLYDKLNIYVGDADSYYLNMGVRLTHDFLSKATNPRWTGEAVFQPMGTHCWGPSMPELMDKMVKQMERRAPAGADLTSWRYGAGAAASVNANGSATLTGKWTFSVVTENGTGTPAVVFTQDGEKLSGTYESGRMGIRALAGTVRKDSIDFVLAGGEVALRFVGRIVDADRLAGVLDMGGQGSATFTAARVKN